MATSSKAREQNETEVKFQAAIARRTLRKPAPPFIQGNRGVPMRTYDEDELQRMTRQVFDEIEAQTRFYTQGLGHDVMWINDWLKKYWAAWSGGIDEAAVHELLAPNVEYKDPLSFGRPMIGVKPFIDYNQAFFDAAPDLRYDGIPGQCGIMLSPSGEVLLMIRYVGCGHWDKPLRMYPFTPGSPGIPGNGKFTQMFPIDRYHFNSDRKLVRGETLWDPLEALQLIRAVPNDTSLTFKAIAKLGGVASNAVRLSSRLPFIGDE